MDAFDDLLQAICERPAMFVGDGRLRHVAMFLDGFTEALSLSGAPCPMAAWRPWIELRYGISDPAWHWTGILIHAFGSDTAALHAIPSLFSEYRKALVAVGVDEIERAHAVRFPRGVEQPRHAPDVQPPIGCTPPAPDHD